MNKLKWLFGLVILTLFLISCGRNETDALNSQKKVQMDEKNQTDKAASGDETAQGADNRFAYMDTTLSSTDRAADLLSRMSTEEKVGQMLQGVREKVSDYEMTDLGLGSILSGGGSYPGNNSIKDWNKMIHDFQAASMRTELQIPMIYGVDAVHGLALVKGAVVFPHNIGLGAANDPELMYRMGAAVAEEMKLNGILWNFSPCVGVNRDPRWGRTYECFSFDPEIVATLSEAYLKGQSDHGVAATAKHYAGDGGTTYGTGELNGLVDRGDTQMSEEEFRKIHLYPYEKLVASGVKIVMASFSSYNGVKMHENKYLLTDILKKEFGFTGFVVSDWEAMNALSGNTFKEDIALALNAGVDMLMEPYNYQSAFKAIIDNIEDGKIPMERIDDAVSRILYVKFEMGLFEDPYMEKLSHEVNELGSAGYREIAKQLVAKSQVLLKNEKQLLPLKKGQKIFVTGPALDDMGLQCGGWGLSWQGMMDNGGAKITKGTTILEGLQEYAKTYEVEIITEDKHAEEADLVLMAIGEIPYAEFEGDTKDLSITGALAHPDNQAVIEYVKSLNKPVITLLLTGRNAMINEYMENWDSIVMSYLPGTEGDGVASVLFGEAPFTGKLSMPYYKTVEDIDNPQADLLFEMGYGLTY